MHGTTDYLTVQIGQFGARRVLLCSYSEVVAYDKKPWCRRMGAQTMSKLRGGRRATNGPLLMQPLQMTAAAHNHRLGQTLSKPIGGSGKL